MCKSALSGPTDWILRYIKTTFLPFTFYMTLNVVQLLNKVTSFITIHPVSGLAGVEGRVGFKGDRGTAGFPGQLGLKGEAGLSGPLGPDGLSGREGLPGLDGMPGRERSRPNLAACPREPNIVECPLAFGLDSIHCNLITNTSPHRCDYKQFVHAHKEICCKIFQQY